MIPLMTVIQREKRKVRPVMDFREMNAYLDPHMADADVCVEKIRRWRRCGRRVALLDLRDACLQSLCGRIRLLSGRAVDGA